MNILSFNHEDDEVKDGDNCARKHAAFQHGFGLSSLPKLKPKTRRNNSFEVHGGRIVRSTGRTDRHSKIATARGTKDRRVRLSPKTAILFYDVQDRLGYDRPSKAIDWLMKEAKAAIDALDEPPPPPTTNAAQIHGSVSQQMLNTDYPISSLGFFTEAEAAAAAAAAAATATATSYDEFNSSISTRTGEQFSSAPLATSPEIFDANLEMARLQRIFSWNYSPPLQFPAVADSGHGHMFSDREPLQSSYSRIFHNSPQFAGVNFSDEEMLNFATSATFKEDDKDDIIIPVSNNS